MSYVSCLEDIDKIRADLEHLANRHPQPACRVDAAPTVFAAAERLLKRVWAVLELGTDPGLDLAAALLEVRDRVVGQERELALLRRQLVDLRRTALMARQEATAWRDAYYAATRRHRTLTSNKAGRALRRR